MCALEKEVSSAERPIEPPEGAVNSWFSRANYGSAFGYYEGIGREERPWNQALIGREPQRARLLDLLFNVGGKGAYLITGHRGSGKTTFVDYCLEQYQSNVFERFLQRNVGRSFLWDRLGYFLLSVLFLAITVLVHDSLAFMLYATFEKKRIIGLVGWPIIFGLALIAFHPFVLALGRIQIVCDRMEEVVSKNTSLLGRVVKWFSGGRSPKPRPLIYVGLIALGLLVHPGIGEPKFAVAHALLFCACVFWVCCCTSVIESGFVARQTETGGGWQVVPTLVAGGASVLLYLLVYWIEDDFSFHQTLLWLIYLISLGLLILAATNFNVTDGFVVPKEDRYKLSQARRAASSARTWYYVVAFVGLGVSVLIYADLERPILYLMFSGFVIFLVSLAVVCIHCERIDRLWVKILEDQEDSDEGRLGSDARERLKDSFAELYRVNVGFIGYPLILLGLKAILFVLAGLYLAFPMLKLLLSSSKAEEWATILPGSSGGLLGELFFSNQKGWKSWVLFEDSPDVNFWIFGMLAAFMLTSFLEYEWIIRAYQAERRDLPMQMTQEGIRQNRKDLRSEKQTHLFEYRNKDYYQRLAEQSLFWRVYQVWQPVLVIPVNLGFDALDHHRVVEAMLAGLRDAYQRTFFRWGSPVYACIRILGFLLVFSATAQATYSWLCLETDEQIKAVNNGIFCQTYVSSSFELTHSESSVLEVPLRSPELERSRDVILSESGLLDPSLDRPKEKDLERQEIPPLMRVACHIGSEPLVQLLQWEILPRRSGGQSNQPEQNSLGSVLSANEDTKEEEKAEVKNEAYRMLCLIMPEIGKAPDGFILRFYHLFLFVVFWFFGSWLIKRFPLFPFRKTLEDLDRLLLSLSSRMREESLDASSPFQRVLGVFTGGEKVHYREADPYDPRSVELATISVLRRIQRPTVDPPFFSRHKVNFPIPEIIFKFDELDKLGLGVIPPHDVTGPEAEQSDSINRERQRAESLRNLFSDLKNVVSSGVARFIFIGGRNLHDEWLADQTARRPLLTNIFEAELYLPSLVVDRAPVSEGKLWKGVQEYVARQRIRAEGLNQKSLYLRYRPWMTPWSEDRHSPSFGLTALKIDTEKDPDLERLPLGTGFRRVGKAIHQAPDWNVEFQRDFIQFLAYRSHGHVKKLRTLLEDFVRPTGSAMAEDECRDMVFDCQHVLLFRDVDRFRIQLIADIYRHIASTFDPRIAYRDDKLLISVFYLSDFLLKFHRRAFTWNSLQKVDELAHIHRAPDLPRAVNDLVFDWMEPYLHTIRNGMYNYRFNSDFARELEYLSRRSEEELAAFNFTLDESQALKAIYRSRIKAVKEPESFETIAALGELHDFDQEYEVARYYYSQAIDLLDQHFHGQTGTSDDTPSVYEVLKGSHRGKESARLLLTWGITRLRLNLQIAMTFERPRELEQAQVHYRNARTLAASLLKTLISDPEKHLFGTPGKSLANPDVGRPDYVSTLKHLFILFQPALAEAWVSEKVVGGVDSSIRLIERRLWELRWRLPFVSEQPYVRDGDLECTSKHPDFALIVAEQHNRAGDLLFFKGKQINEITLAQKANREQDGYLKRAQYHYTLSLHDIQAFNRSRRIRFGSYGDFGPSDESKSVLPGMVAWGDFVYRASAGSLADLSETLLAQVSLPRLLGQEQGEVGKSGDDVETRKLLENSFRGVYLWLDGSPKEMGESVIPDLFPSLAKNIRPADKLNFWLGSRKYIQGNHKDFPSEQSKDLLVFEQGKNSVWDMSLLANYALICLNAGRLLEEGGYHEDAARKNLRVVETIDNYLRWILIFEVCSQELQSSSDFERQLPASIQGALAKLRQDPERLQGLESFLLEWLSVGMEALRHASELFLRSRLHIETRPPRKEGHRQGLIGSRIPVTALSLACSMGLSIVALWSKINSQAKEGIVPDGLKPIMEGLSDVLEHWVVGNLRQEGGEELLDLKGCRARLREILRHHLEAFSYPLIHRLNGLKALHDDEMFHLFASFSKTFWKEKIKKVCAEEEHSRERRQKRPFKKTKKYIHEHYAKGVGMPGSGGSVPSEFERLREFLIQHIQIEENVEIQGADDETIEELEKFREKVKVDCLFRVAEYLEELVELSDVYESPLHFTPLQTGLSLSLFYLLERKLKLNDLRSINWRKGWDTVEEIGHFARNQLQQSREMYTMGRMYYHAISDQYYLYDDFNDRRIHYNHAIQMAAGELNILLDKILAHHLEEGSVRRRR